MDKHQLLHGVIGIFGVFLLTFIVSACNPTPGEQELVNIPGGLMLVEDGKGGRHPVLLYDYQILSRLVTNDEFAQCVDAKACEPLEESEDGSSPAGVNWYQAQAYCETLGGRLPTEAELSKVTHPHEDCPDSDYGIDPIKGYGEWLYDWDHPDYYNQSLVTNPFGPLYGDLKLVMGLDRDPRMAMPPEDFDPQVGFRCVTQGATLAFAPFCKNRYRAYCSPPDEGLQAPLAMVFEALNTPNFNIIAALCPDNGRVKITVEHYLPSAEGLEVKDLQSACNCEIYADYPDRLYCNCNSPGAGNYLNVDICQTGKQIPVSADDFCPQGYSYNTLTGMCTRDSQSPVQIYSLDAGSGSPGNLSCPSNAGLPIPADRYLGLESIAANGELVDMVDKLSLRELPEGDDWTLSSISDGSGLCPPGYYFNEDTHCCSPISEENYGCDEGQYFDAGLKQCLSINADGCGPCQAYDFLEGCVPEGNEKFLSYRCNTDDSEGGVTYDEYGRPGGGSGVCGATAYFDANLDRCVETPDGCPVGYYLDPDTQTCIPISGPKSPCSIGYTFHTDIGCCIPSPGEGGSECPEGTEFTGVGCSPGIDGCPSSHFYNTESDSCLLRYGGESLLETTEAEAGHVDVIQGESGTPIDCGTFDTSTDSCLIIQPEHPICSTDKYFDAILGFCRGLIGNGALEKHFTVEIEEGRIASITRISPDVIDPASASTPPDEGGTCPWNLYMNADGVCTPQTCTSLRVSVPPCPRTPSSSSGSSGSQCDGLGFGVCQNTPGCHWDTQDGCVPD